MNDSTTLVPFAAPLRVFVYWNLHRSCWSVKALQGPQRGRVIAHESMLTLRGCTFKVSESGRQRVIRDKRKNVHAGVVGTWAGDGSTAMAWARGAVAHVTYNPYRFSTFVDRETLAPITGASLAHLHDRKVTAWDAT